MPCAAKLVGAGEQGRGAEACRMSLIIDGV